MKTAIILITSLFLSSAFASQFEENCSSANGNVYFESGNIVGQKITITKYTNEGDSPSKEKVSLDPETHKVEKTEENLLSESKNRFCNEEGFGGLTQTSLKYSKLRITKQDGGSFPEGTLNLSSDKKSVETIAICREHGEFSIVCK